MNILDLEIIMTTSLPQTKVLISWTKTTVKTVII